MCLGLAFSCLQDGQLNSRLARRRGCCVYIYVSAYSEWQHLHRRQLCSRSCTYYGEKYCARRLPADE